ncbi:hypothetical protein QWM81_27245 [Streptomyces ficellus]|uniref:LPXTG cell wall anchor domain-containing protein n=1 Tax=Streptomyces ficellus TaxID=1977088 RepID=A0ABT7ZDZ1_9ACTN|nr:hypothetical protein [Streptomyces ficellus]MDN3297668.1 hypothetical protein [Streptomyces ficellus]
MSVARRPLLTATAAGTLLGALWFVPSANATVEQAPAEQHGTRTSTTAKAQQQLVLADTGSVDTTPYVIGGTAFLGIGTGLVAFAVRRGAHTAL